MVARSPHDVRHTSWQRNIVKRKKTDIVITKFMVMYFNKTSALRIYNQNSDYITFQDLCIMFSGRCGWTQMNSEIQIFFYQRAWEDVTENGTRGKRMEERFAHLELHLFLAIYYFFSKLPFPSTFVVVDIPLIRKHKIKSLNILLS